MAVTEYTHDPSTDQWWSPAEVGAWLGISIDLVKDLLRDGDIPSVKIRGSRRVSSVEVVNYLNRLYAEQAPPTP